MNKNNQKLLDLSKLYLFSGTLLLNYLFQKLIIFFLKIAILFSFYLNYFFK